MNSGNINPTRSDRVGYFPETCIYVGRVPGLNLKKKTKNKIHLCNFYSELKPRKQTSIRDFSRRLYSISGGGAAAERQSKRGRGGGGGGPRARPRSSPLGHRASLLQLFLSFSIHLVSSMFSCSLMIRQSTTSCIFSHFYQIE